jgi:hypothetical protein
LPNEITPSLGLMGGRAVLAPGVAICASKQLLIGRRVVWAAMFV